MSVTSSRAADRERSELLRPAQVVVPLTEDERLRRSWARVADVSFAVIAVTALVLMARNPEWATIPYHLMFLSLTLVYGFRVWALPATILVIGAVTSATGALMINEYLDEVIDGPELAEIPLMPALVVAMVWHARRRAATNLELRRMTAQQQGMIHRERTFFRDTSHALRTPVSIARGHLELAEAAAVQPEIHEDLSVAVRQLDRLSVLSNRLLTLAQLDSGEAPPGERMDLADFVHETWDNWSARSQRRWEVDCPATALFRADPVWLALAIDALVENAVHFTADDGTISICGSVRRDTCVIAVADDGVGISSEDLEHVFDRFWHRRPPSGPMGSGLGLAMARASARAWGGDLAVCSRPGLGARFEFTLPRADLAR
jgi:signal transduction histidine kinase